MKNILLVGSSSSVAIDLYTKYHNNYNFIRLSRDKEISHVNNFDVLNNSTYFSPSENLDGLVYFPGTINLKPFERLKVSDYQNDFNINFIIRAFKNFFVFIYFVISINKKKYNN